MNDYTWKDYEENATEASKSAIIAVFIPTFTSKQITVTQERNQFNESFFVRNGGKK